MGSRPTRLGKPVDWALVLKNWAFIVASNVTEVVTWTATKEFVFTRQLSHQQSRSKFSTLLTSIKNHIDFFIFNI